MASNYTQESNAMPHLVVKIVGSKQIKYFAEEPNKTMELNQVQAEEVLSTVSEDVSVHTDKPTTSETSDPKQSLQHLFLNKALNEETRVLRELRQNRDRQCVTAPCGDRSLSYIHLKKSLSAVNDLQGTETQQQALLAEPEEGELKDGEQEEEERRLVLQAIGEELGGWGASSSSSSSSALANIERDVQELDTSHTGAIRQSQLTYVFLRNEVPLKLPTLGRLLQLFSKETCPDEVLYKELLQFLSDIAQDDQRKMKGSSTRTKPDTGFKTTTSSSTSN